MSVRPDLHGPWLRWLRTAAVAVAGAAVLALLFPRDPRRDVFAPRAQAGPRAELEGAYPLASLQVMGECIDRMRRRFVAPDRVHPRAMMAEALSSLQRHVVPLLLRLHDDDPETGPRAVTVRIGERERRFSLSQVGDLDQMMNVSRSIFGFIDANLPRGTNRETLETVATNGMLHTLDPHTTYLDPTTYRNMQVETSGKFGGLGIVISIYKGDLTIISVMEDTPAYRKGLKSRDAILQIEDESTVNMDLTEAVSRLRGKPGTPVTIHVLRKGWQSPRPFTVVRDRITIRSVVSEPLGEGMGYVRLKNFRANTAAQLRAHLLKLERLAGGPLKGVVLDLRGDPGGFLEQAIRVADLFLPSGEIVRTIGPGGRVRDRRDASQGPTAGSAGNAKTPYETVPLIVLIDGGSASASEIVAGALKNHRRGLVLGTRSFGKGTVQGIYEIGDGAVKITIAEYLTPGGVPVHEVGVVPDLELQAVEVGAGDLLIYAHTDRAGKTDRPSRRAHYRRLRAPARPRRLIRFVHERKDDPDDEDARDARRFQYDELKRDFPLEAAEAILRVARGPRSTTMLQDARGTLDLLERREAARLEKALGARGVNWSAGPRLPRPRLEAEITPDPTSAVVRAGETLEITVRLRNTGTRPLYRLHAITSSTTRLLDGREFLFGKLDPGQLRSWTVKIEPDLSAFGRYDPMTVEFYQDGKKIGLSRKLVVGVEEAPKPAFAFGYLLDDQEHGNGDGRVQRGEEVTLHMLLQNVGRGSARETVAALKNLAGDSIFLRKGRHREREPFEPGAVRDIPFAFEVRPALTTSGIPFDAQLSATKTAVWLRERVEIPLHGASNRRGMPAAGARWAATDTLLRSGASTRFPGIVRLPAGAPVELETSSGGWVRARAGKTMRGWVRTRDLSESPPASGASAEATVMLPFRPPEIRILAPLGGTRLTTAGRSVLRAEVTFYRAGRPLERAATVYVGGEKVWFDIRRHVDSERIVIPIDVPLKLEPGPNRITIRAIERDRVERALIFFVHRAEKDPRP